MTLIKALICTILTFFIVSCQKDTDESRPYEFGFTIDGEQHRHEKKDVNGIIQGEFGFITADGIYHVTVYATDENGDFKILSMRNIRISAPLDGSPLPPGQTISANPFTKSNAIQPSTQNQPIQGQPPIHAKPIQPSTQNQPIPGQPPTYAQPIRPQPPAQIQSVQTTTTRPRTTFLFTTQPTIKPACGGCGYVTTAKPKPGEPFPFQTPAFQKPNSGSNNPNSGAISNTAAINSPNLGPVLTNSVVNKIKNPVSNQGIDNSNLGTNIPNANYPTTGPGSASQPPNSFNPGSSNSNTGANYPSSGTNSQNLGTNYQNSAIPSGANYPNSGINSQNLGTNYQSFGTPSRANYPSLGTNDKNSGTNYENPGTNYQNPETNYYNPNSGSNANKIINNPETHPNKPLSQVSVTDGVIHVPGNPDIPIKDKYPGMVDGLPNGINQKDVTDLLYKFNYTVGFHGHYEKGLKNGAKIGGYFVNGRDGLSRIVTYVADENGFRPKVKFIRLDLNSDDVPKEGTEKTFGLKNFEFVWYPVS